MFSEMKCTHYLDLANQSIVEISLLNDIDHSVLIKTQLGILLYMLFREFIQDNITSLEIPFQVEEKRKYPPSVWSGLHKSILVTQVQHTTRTDTIKSLINSVVGGDDLGGLTIDNVIDMWLDSMLTVATHMVGSALGNSKINQLFKKLATDREIECFEAHNEIEEQIVKKGVKLPTHTHTVKSIDVADDNREQFDEFVNLVLMNFDSEVYGELPAEYKKAREGDIEAMISELQDLVGDDTDVARSLIRKEDGDDSGDYI